MLASEVIFDLQCLIAKHGDLPVWFEDTNGIINGEVECGLFEHSDGKFVIKY